MVAAQQLDPFVLGIWKKMEAGEAPHFFVGVDGGLRYDMHLYVPQVEEVKQSLLDEAHRSRYTIHPRSTKMFKDLKRNF